MNLLLYFIVLTLCVCSFALNVIHLVKIGTPTGVKLCLLTYVAFVCQFGFIIIMIMC